MSLWSPNRFLHVFLAPLAGFGLLLLSSGAAAVYEQSTGSQHIVAMEAENFHGNTAQGGHQWIAVASPQNGFSGSGAMVTTPNTETNQSNFVALSPRLDFEVNFVTTGTHYIHVRGRDPFADGTNDSVHVGLNGQAIASADDVHLEFGTTNYVWNGVTRTFNVTSTGVHTVNVWMREDATEFDRIVLTTDPGFAPSGQGPAESPQNASGNFPPVARDDAFAVAQDSLDNALAVLADNGSGADSDPEGDALQVTVVGTTSDGGSAIVNAGNDGVVYTPAPGFVGVETFTYTLSDGTDTDEATVSVTVNATSSGGGGGDAFQQALGGDFIVSMEAENFHANTAQGSHQWIAVASPQNGFSGSGAMVTTPNAGINQSNFVAQSPRLDFEVHFTTTGTHYIHVRGRDPFADGTNDSVHVGLNGQAIASADDVHLDFGTTNYVWNGVTRTFNVPSTGVHTVNVWMREDGTQFDKIVLTRNAGFVPSGSGPAESGRVSGGGNQPPVARDDTFTVNQDSSANALAVLTNNGSGADSDPDGDPLEVTAVGATSNGGTATINATGTGIVYTPAAGFFGQETFTYTLSDGTDTDVAQVTVNVNAVSSGNQPPVARDDSFTVDQDSSNNALAVLADNGSGADSDPEGDPLQVTAVGATSNGGTATINGAGTGIVYTPAAGFSGQETFGYTLSDGTATDVGQVTVNVNPISGGGGGTGAFQQSSGGDFIVAMEAENFHANTAQGSHQWIAVASPQNGFSGSGVMVTTPNTETNQSNFVSFSPRLDFQVNFTATGTHYIHVRGRDPFADGTNDSVHVGLNGQAIASADDVHLDFGTTSYVWNGVTRTFNVPSTGVHTVNVWMREDGTQFDKIVLTRNAGFVPSGSGPAESGRVSSGGNQPPVARDDTFTVDQDSSGNALAVLADNGNGADSDPEGDPLEVTAVGATSNGGTATINATGTGIVYTPAAGFSGQETFTYTLSDGTATDGAQVTVTVDPISSGGGGTGAFQQSSGGDFIVSMEAENFHTNTAQGSHQWIAVASPQNGFSGSGVMVTTPNTETNQSNFVALSPRLDFEVNFATTGTHYIHVRGRAPIADGTNDSVHVGLNGQAIGSADDVHLDFGTTNYVWNGVTRSFNVPSTGVHTVNVWMREDGTEFDKIVLTTNPGYAPSGSGPGESTRPGGCQTTPSVTLVSPEAGHLQSSSELFVDTLTCLNPSIHGTWGIRVRLDGGTGGQQFRYAEPWSVTFSGVDKAEHTVDVTIVDGSGTPVAGSNNQDSVGSVGVGDYYVGFGDSITWGTGDDIAADDVSADGRNDSRGYTPVLGDLLTAEKGYPNLVVNEGVGGETSADGLARLPGVLASHPEAQRYIVKFGMNDAGGMLPVPSGEGLSPGAGGYPGSFKDVMQQIIDAINGAGKEVILVKVNIALAPRAASPPGDYYADPNTGARSVQIQAYNRVLDELRAIPGNAISIAIPDLYAWSEANFAAEYDDAIHPNGIGYQSVAVLIQAVIP